jgi:glycosyltransferase involved in cell wall biosynthesis
MPFFSIIIPTYNRAHLIAQTIQSVFEQQFSDFELIIIDDGSTDSTQEVLSMYKDSRIRCFSKENAERAAARNFGVEISTGEYITFIDSDDLVYANHLSKAYELIRSYSNPPVFHVGYEIKQTDGEIVVRYNSLSNINAMLLKGNPLSCIGVFLRRDVILDNLFNEDRELSGLEDWELWIRISAQYRFVNSTEITAAMIQHPARSVMQIDAVKLKRKAELLIKYVCENQRNIKTFGKKLRQVSASVKTYVALHLALANKNKTDVLQYTFDGVKENPMEMFRKRFYVILKTLLTY